MQSKEIQTTPRKDNRSMSKNHKLIKIAIDGPAGAGKSTVALMVARKFGYIYLDTGAMYRAITLLVLRAKIALDDGKSITELLKTSTIDVRHDQNGKNQIFINGNDVTDDIREQSVSNAVSEVANILAVRKMLIEMQRQIAAKGGVVLDGRDIGTVVLPDAELKIYLIASLAVRAQRRYSELRAKESDISLSDLTEAIDIRDKKDAKNAYGPLKVASDAMIIDTDHLAINDVVEKISELAKEKIHKTADV